MSRVIDERVVSMQFDNKQFESNVSTTMSTLEKLKRSLNFTGASKGLENINSAAKGCNLSPISSAVDAVGLKFNAMYTIADQALRNITTRVQQTAEHMVKAFTIDPIKTGFQEYETQINAVQTILANTESKGETLETVNAALDELNTYADKTIYNFTEMTRNIGTFTAAGVELDVATNAIQGIANLAAVSGSNAQQASTAMYQLSQALASGTVKLMDWNSVVNAGMGGQVFQDALKETARVHGVAIDQMIKDNGSFRETLKDGWLTSEILTETLQKFTLTTEGLTDAQIEANRQMLKSKGYTDAQIEEIFKLGETATNAATKVKTFTQLMDTLKEAAQSGWTQSWELIVGDFEEAKSLWTGVSDTFGEIINASSQSRNDVLAGALNSKWDNFIEKMNEVGLSTEEFEGTLSEVLKDHGYDVDTMIEKYGSFEAALKEGAYPVANLKEAIDRLSISMVDLSDVEAGLTKGSKGDQVKKVQEVLDNLGFDLGKWGVDGIIGSQTEAAIKAFQELEGLEVTGIIDDETLKALNEAQSSMGDLKKELMGLIDGVDELGGREKLIRAFKNLWEALTKPIKAVGKAWNNVFGTSTEEKSAKLLKLIEGFESFTEKLIISGDSADEITRIFGGLFSLLKTGGMFVGGGFKMAFQLLSGVLENFDLNILEVAAAIGDALTAVHNWISENNYLADALTFVFGMLVAGALKVKEWIDAFITLPQVQERIAAIGEAFSNIGDYFSGGIKKVQNFISLLKKIDLKTLFGNTNFSKTLRENLFKNFQTNVLGYFSNIGEKLGGFVSNIVASLVLLRDSAGEYLGTAGERFQELRDKISSFFTMVREKLGANMGKILALGTLITFLLIVKKIKDAVELIAHPLDMVDDFLDGLGKSVKQFAKAAAIKNIAASIAILAASVAVLALLPQKKVWSAVGAIVALGAGLVVMAKMMDKIDAADLSKLSLSLLSMGGALLLIATAVRIIGGMEGGDWLKGTLSIVAFMGMISVVAKSAKGLGRGVSDFGKMMTRLSIALLGMAIVVKIFGNMDTGTLLKGGGAVTFFLLTMLGMMKMSSIIGRNSAKFGSMMIKLGGALLLMAWVIKILGGMDTETMVKGGAAVVIFLGTIVGLMAATKLIGDGDIAKFGTMMLGIGTSLILMTGAIKILAGMNIGDIIKGELAIAGMVGIIVGLMAATKLLGKYSFNSGKVGVMLIGFATAVMMLSGSILLLSMIDGSDLKKAMLAMTGIGAILAGLIFATKYAKSIKLGTIVAMSIAVGVLAASVMALSFITGKKLAGATAAVMGITGMFALLALATKSLSAKTTIGLLIMTATVGALAYILHKLANVENPDTVLKVATALSEVLLSLSISCALLGVIGSLGPMVLIGAALLALVLGVLSGFAAIGIAALPTIGKKLGEFGEAIRPFMDVTKDITPDFADGIKNLAEAFAILTGTAFVDAIGSKIFGGSALDTFGKQIAKFGVALAAFMRTVSKPFNELSGVDGVPAVDIDNVNAAIDAGVRLSELANTIPDTSGLSTKFGKKDIGVFGDQIAAFATGLVGFLQKVSAPFFTLSSGSDSNLSIQSETIDFEAVGSAVDVAVDLADIASTIPDTSGWSTKFAKKDLGAFGTQIATFATGLSKYLIAISAPLTKIGETQTTTEVKSVEINWDNIKQATSVASDLADLAEDIPDTSGWSTIFEKKDLSEFGTQIAAFANGLATYLSAMSDPIATLVAKTPASSESSVDEVNWDSVKKATGVATDLATIANDIPDTSGWSTTFGGKNLGEFGTQVASFASGLALYLSAMSDPIASLTSTATGDNSIASAVDEVNWDSIKEATGVATDLAGVAATIPETSKWGEWFSGNKDLSAFSSQLKAFATGLVTYLATMSDPIASLTAATQIQTEDGQATASTINWSTIKSATGVATDLAGVANSIPETSKWGEIFSGNKNMGTFGTQLATFANGLTKFLTDTNAAFNGLSEAGSSEAVSINMNNVSAAVDVALKLADLATTISNNSAGWDWLTGKDDLSDFGTDLTNFAQGLSGFSAEVSELNTSGMTAAADAASTIVDISTTVGDSSTDNLATLGGNILSFGKQLGMFFDEVTTVNTVQIAMIAASIKQIMALGKEGSGLDFSALSNLSDALGEIGTDSVDKFVAAFQNSGPKVMAAARAMVTMLRMGIIVGGSLVVNASKTIATQAASSLKNKWSAFYDAGKFLVQGFASGITINTFRASAAAKAMATAAYQAAKEVLKINSPSKAFRSLGYSVPEGFAMGIDRLSGLVKDSSVSMAKTAINGTKNAIAHIADVINSDIDAQPTIRPVVDLTNVRSGANSISSMFNMQPSIATMSNVSAISTMMATSQNGSNSDVISAIEDLGRRLGKPSGDTYNFNGITYDDGSNISDAVKTLVNAARVERRR